MSCLGARRPAFSPCYLAPPPVNRRFAMARPAPIYDLMLLLDPAAPDEQRAKVLSDVEAMVSGAGSIVGEHDWGTRALAYEIDHRPDAEYHLLQFQGPAELLANLQRTLRITDGIVRFRIIKLAPGTPSPPDVRAPERAEAPAEAPAAS
jgi:small subunit ribosomal protein S6